ncbi:MAG: Ig-like domain-containing protein [Planctomycetota bacterium]
MLIVALAACFAACSSDDDDAGGALPQTFALESTNVMPGAVWALNRPIELVFTRPVDFSTAGPGSFVVLDDLGVPAMGTVRLAREDTDGDGVPDSVDERRLLLEPHGPLRPDLSDVGLRPGRTYTLTLVANGIADHDGQTLADDVSIEFATRSAPPLFFDPVEGPPTAVRRPVGSQAEWGTLVRLGGDGGTPVYFEEDPTTGAGQLSPPGAALGLDLYSDPGTTPVFFVVLDQPISPATANLGAVWLAANSPGQSPRVWRTDVALVANDVTSGAVLRLQPDGGPLPRGGQVRAVLGPGLMDLAGEQRASADDAFAVAPVEAPETPGLVPAGVVADAVVERPARAQTDGDATTAEVTSRWYALGAADRDATGALVPVRFRFRGVDPSDGRVLTSGASVLPPQPALGPFAIGAGSPEAHVVAPDTLVVGAADLVTWLFTIGPADADIYLRSPALLVGADVECSNGLETRLFRILGADYDAVGQVLTLSLSSEPESPADFLAAGTSVTTGAIRERFFRIVTAGVPDELPPDALVTFHFQAVGATPDDEPDESDVIVDWTPDVSQFQGMPPGTLRFFRWRIGVDCDVSGDGLTPGESAPVIESLQLPFRF